MPTQSNSWFDVIVGYTVSSFAYIQNETQDLDWLAIGAAVLLICRLIQDVPKAYASIRKWFTKDKETEETDG